MKTAEMDLRKSVAVLGATSAIARSVAGCFARAGYAVVLGARDEAENEIIATDIATRHRVDTHALYFDALDFGAHPAFVESCRNALGRLPTGIVVCFGEMYDQSETQVLFETARSTIDANFTSVVSIANLFANCFEARENGFICVLSSVAGDRGRKTNYTYGAAKAGLTAYLSGLRNRLHQSGVDVITVKPGFVDTRMTYGMDLPGPLVASPAQAGRAIFDAVMKRKNTVYVPWFWRYIMLIIRNIPERQFKKMSI